MAEETKPKGRAIVVPDPGENFPTATDIEDARDLARRISPTLLAMFDAEEYKPPADPDQNDKE